MINKTTYQIEMRTDGKHRVIVTVEGAEEGMMYQFPSEGRQTARSVFWSPS